MKWKKLSVFLALFVLIIDASVAQIPTLPENAQTKWMVSGPEEVVTYLIFDPATVKKRLPSSLRFIRIEELAVSQIPWASEHLKEYPDRADWGISFFEILRMKTFEIDRHKPKWPEHGAIALWCARVSPSNRSIKLGPGRAFLILEFWLPDRDFVDYMCKKGHYARYGDVRLKKDSEGKWLGSVKVESLKINCECMPTGDVKKFSSGGRQTFSPPAKSGITSIVQVAFAGHQIQECSEDASWRFKGDHPLVKGIVLGASTFQFGYNLIGGAYKK